MQFLLIGLGNIGSDYTYTRHNVGFLAVDYVAMQHKVTFNRVRYALMGSFQVKAHQIYIIKPTTYMNNSGQAVRYWLQKLKIPIEQSLTIVDDIGLPFGSTRFRIKGSTGGHNGLKSLETCLVSNSYARLRIGIGCNFSKGELAKFVLNNFLPQELKALSLQFDYAHKIVLDWCDKGAIYVMNTYNKKGSCL